MVEMLRSVDEGVQRLMSSMFDIVQNDWSATESRRAEAPVEFQKLYKGYISILRVAHGEAHRRWEGTVRALQDSKNLSEDDALDVAYDQHWAGPGGDPNVVWVVRLIWLECDRLNSETQPSNRIRPEALLLQWLIDDKEDALVTLIACMPYWPIGLDADGNWC